MEKKKQDLESNRAQDQNYQSAISQRIKELDDREKQQKFLDKQHKLQY